MKSTSNNKDHKKPNKKTSKPLGSKKTAKKEALGSGWHPLLLLVLSVLVGVWMLF